MTRGDAGDEEPLHLPIPGEREFRVLRDLVYQEAGIHLVPAKKALLTARLQRRLRELGLDFKGYVELLQADPSGAEQRRFIEAICTHETSFFREKEQWEFLDQEVFPRWAAAAAAGRRPLRLRAWSAGCSSGEEPFSLAMILAARFPRSAGFQVEVVATDLSEKVLQRARAAEWPIERAGEIPQRLLKAFMLRGTGENERRMRASEALRDLVQFRQVNLNLPLPPDLGLFDLVLCRNVLIYFDGRSRERALDGLLAHLATGGYFLVGHAETLSGLGERVRAVRPTIYSHPQARTGEAP
jgi:chemotaxis protein methyltransferase CheR